MSEVSNPIVRIVPKNDKPEMSTGQAVKKLAKYIAIFNVLPALVMAVLAVFVLDVITNLTHYHGAGKVVMAILLLLVTFAIDYFIVWAAEILLIGGLGVFYIAGRAIFGGKRKPRAATTSAPQPNNQA